MGLAIASLLSEHHEDILVVERNARFGEETSSRNSEVIHSGIYYPTNSLKAKFCVEGRDMLYELCEKEGIKHRRCGKLIVATSEEQREELRRLDVKARANSVCDLVFMSQEEVRKMEPNVFALEALFSPSTGIIDSHELMHHFESKSRDGHVDFAYQSEVKNIEKTPSGYRVTTIGESRDEFSFSTSVIINSAGLEADKIASLVGIEDENYHLYFCKGDYFSVKPPKNKLVNRLIYPVPFKKLVGLGVHGTIDMGGGLRLGPNATYLDKKEYDYHVDESSRESFWASAKKFMPFLELEDLTPYYAGIRPKIQAPGEEVKDFIVVNEATRGFPNFINLIGIESPGLTSCMAIAKYVNTLIE